MQAEQLVSVKHVRQFPEQFAVIFSDRIPYLFVFPPLVQAKVKESVEPTADLVFVRIAEYVSA